MLFFNMIFLIFSCLFVSLLDTCHVRFNRQRDGDCRRFDTVYYGHVNRHLRCVLQGPMVEILGITCPADFVMSHLQVVLTNFEQLETLLLENGATLRKLLALFPRTKGKLKSLQFELTNFLSSTDYDIFIDRQWLENFIRPYEPLITQVVFNLSTIRLEPNRFYIHEDIDRFGTTLRAMTLHVRNATDTVCRMFILPQNLRRTAYRMLRCREVLTLINENANSSGSFWPISVRKRVVNRTISTPTETFESPSNRWTKVFLPIIVLMIIIGAIFWCFIRKIRGKSLANSFTQPMAMH